MVYSRSQVHDEDNPMVKARLMSTARARMRISFVMRRMEIQGWARRSELTSIAVLLFRTIRVADVCLSNTP